MKSMSAVAVLLNEPGAISASATSVTKSYANGSNKSSGFGLGLLERVIVSIATPKKKPDRSRAFPNL
jgi:hypothetical protein